MNGDFYIHLPVNGLFHQLQTFGTDAQAVFLPCIYALRSGNSVVSVRNSIFSQPFYAEEVCRADEVRHERRLRFKVDLLGRSCLMDDAAFKDDNHVRHGKSFRLVMGDINRGKSHLLLNITEFHADAFAQLRIQIGQRFIKKKNFRIHDKGTGHSNTLLLSAGHLVRETVLHAFKLHEVKRFFDTSFYFLFRTVLHTKSIGNIIKNVHMRKEGIFLKYHGRISAVRRNPFDSFAVKKYFPIIRFIETCHHAEKRGLPAA